MSSYQDQWREQGYLVLRGVLAPDLVADLQATSARVYDQWKAETTQDSEPGHSGYGPKAWFILHMNNPKYHAGRENGQRLLLETMGAGLAAEVLDELFRTDYQMVQTNLYIDPPGDGWPGGWHRDCQFFATTDEEVDKAILEEADPPREVHMHIPLVPTSATSVVTGSHRRPDTPEERAVRTQDATAPMPGEITLELAPGDLAFFHVNTIHKGTYTHGVPRRTIAVSYCSGDYPRHALPGEFERRAGYYANYQPWFLSPSYLDGLSDEAKRHYKRLIEIYHDTWTPECLDVLTPAVHEYYRQAFAYAGITV